MYDVVKNFAITGIIVIGMLWIAVDDYIEKEEVKAEKQAVELKAKELRASQAREAKKKAQEEARKFKLASQAYKGYKAAIPPEDLGDLLREKKVC